MDQSHSAISQELVVGGGARRFFRAVAASAARKRKASLPIDKAIGLCVEETKIGRVRGAGSAMAFSLTIRSSASAIAIAARSPTGSISGPGAEKRGGYRSRVARCRPVRLAAAAAETGSYWFAHATRLVAITRSNASLFEDTIPPMVCERFFGTHPRATAQLSPSAQHSTMADRSVVAVPELGVRLRGRASPNIDLEPFSSHPSLCSLVL